MPTSSNDFSAAAARRARSEGGATLSETLLWAALILGIIFWGTTVLGITIALVDKGTGAWWVVLVFGALPFLALYRVGDRLLHRRGAPSATSGFASDLPSDGAVDTPPSPESPALVEQLTPRELEVLALLEKGRTNGEIAQELYVSPATVKSHVNAILRKLGSGNRTEAVARARHLDLIA